jgi:carboxylate-amine ligase
MDDNKIRAARHGTEANLIDFRAGRQARASEMAKELVELLAPDADALGCAEQLGGIADILENGTGAQRQLDMWEQAHDLPGLTAEIAAHTTP